MSKKALNFDLDDGLLKRNYPSNNYKKTWNDIRAFLVKSGLFIDSIQVMFLVVVFQ